MKKKINFDFLREKALEIRKGIFDTALRANKGHIPPAFSCVELLVSVYYSGLLRFSSKNPNLPERDRFILSKGHACLTLYNILADLNFFSKKELLNFSQGGSILAGHPERIIPGIETCTGSLGHGLGVGCGIAKAAQLNNKKFSTIVVLGDGECHEGSIWEAAMFAGHHKLRNLMVIVDRNQLGATDFTENYASLDPLDERFKSFGWSVKSIDGHSFEEIINYLDFFVNKNDQEKPLCIVANTIKGKGLSFMENSKDWHHQMPNKEQIEIAKQELFIND